MMLRKKRTCLAFFLTVFFLFPHAALGQLNTQSGNTRFGEKEAVISQIKKHLPGYHYHNLSVGDSSGYFFAFHPDDTKTPFGWYRVSLKNKLAAPKLLLSSSQFSLVFRTAISPGGKEMITTSKTGEIAATNLRTGKKTTLGVFTSTFPLGEFATYSYPAYTPDGKHIILHNRWANTLLILRAKEKDINKGTVIPGFWLKETGGELPQSGENISVYEFSADGKKVTFGGGHVLNLETLTKEE